MIQPVPIYLRGAASLAILLVAASAFAGPGRRAHGRARRPLRPHAAAAGIAPRLLGICSCPVAGALAFSADGKRLAAGSGSAVSSSSPGEVRVWDIETGRVMYNIPCSAPISAIALAPAGDTLAASTVQSRVIMLSAKTGMPMHSLTPPNSAGGLCLAFTPNGGVLATGGGDLAGNQMPGEARLWDVRSGSLMQTVPHPHRAVVSLQFASGSGDCLIASRGLGADSTGALDLWDKTLHTHRWTRATPDLVGAALVSGGASVASLQSEAAGSQYVLHVRLWNGKTGAPQSGYRVPMGGWAISPGGGLIASSGDDRKSIAVRDARSGRLAQRLACSYPPAGLSFAFSADGHYLAAGTQDGTVLLWTLK